MRNQCLSFNLLYDKLFVIIKTINITPKGKSDIEYLGIYPAISKKKDGIIDAMIMILSPGLLTFWKILGNKMVVKDITAGKNKKRGVNLGIVPHSVAKRNL